MAGIGNLNNGKHIKNMSSIFMVSAPVTFFLFGVLKFGLGATAGLALRHRVAFKRKKFSLNVS